MPLRLPVILVGDSKLGGISQTISAWESLKIRGYDVEAILLFQDEDFQNDKYLAEYFDKNHRIPVISIPQPPIKEEDNSADEKSMSEYYSSVIQAGQMDGTLKLLDCRHQERIGRIESMSRNAHRQIWYPFTQQKLLTPEKITVIDSARGDHFQTLSTESLAPSQSLLQPSFDGSASWWTQGLGHSNPSLTLAAAYAAGRYGHVMFAEAIHEPGLALAETLLHRMKNPRLTRVFYSDNGSTGAEVALKMGLRAARVRYGWGPHEKLEILGLKGSYHGDTMGAMDSAEPNVFNEKTEWYEGKGFWFDCPSVKCSDGKWVVKGPADLQEASYATEAFKSLADVFNLEERRGSHLYRQYETHIRNTLDRLKKQKRKFGALIMAGGMIFV
jgi:dethiobiotin synthetase/adenosylmethionine--8-amino-7-oxononanoate aminotransferase